MTTPMPYSIIAAAFLLAHLPALAADSAVITNTDQGPWIINAGGVLKSETELTIENHRGKAVDAFGVTGVAGQKVAGVSMPGVKDEIEWSQSDEGLTLSVPEEKPCKHAYVYKIDLNK